MMPSPPTTMPPLPEQKPQTLVTASPPVVGDAAVLPRPRERQESPRRKHCVGPGKSWIVSGRGLFR